MSKYNKEDLEKLIIEEALSYEAIGKMYGVTGNAIKKAARRLDIDLPERRKINECENFSKPNVTRSKIDKISDAEFIEVINNNTGWKAIGIAFGYSNSLNMGVKEKILKRCSMLGMEPKIKNISPIMLKTKGELLSERKNYQSYRSSIRKLAEKVYKDSGKEFKCAICGYDKHIEIAHIKAVSDFPDDTSIAEINNINNLIGLCPNHHWEFDNGILKLNT